MNFEEPLYLWLLAPALALVGSFFWWAWRTKRLLIRQFISARLLPSLTLGVSPERQKARMTLVVIALGLILLTLARPQVGFSLEEAHSRGLDIVVAIDTSRSMLATDVAPNRLRRAQLAALDLKRLAKSDRLGVVAFAGSAFLQCPLTLDDEAFRQSVESLDVNIIPQGGTALSEAIQAARSAFKEGNDNHKVLVLFTDGEDHDGEAMTAAKEATKEGLRIFTIGVGTPNGDVLRTTDVQGRTEFIKGPDGNAVRSQLNEGLLQDLAEATGGFYRQLAGANTMNVLYEYGLSPLPKGELASQKIKRPHERYQWLLALAIMVLLAEMLVPERNESKRANAGIAKAASFVILILLLPAAASAGSTKALKQYDAGKFESSQLEYERMLKGKKADDPKLHYNAGAAAFQTHDYQTAVQHLNSALVAQDVPLQQRAYYNLGNSHYRLGEDAKEPDKKKSSWERAAKNFESAIKLDPKDEDAKFNLEFVKQKLEELKQQQQQQQKDDKKDDKKEEKKDQQDKNNDPNKDQKKDDQQKKDGDQKDQQNSDQQKQDQQKKEEEQKKQEEKKAADQKKKDAEEKQEKQDEQASKEAEEQGQDEKDGTPQAGKVMKMTPQQAMQFLDMLKSEEKNMPFRPILRTNRQQRVFKDW